MNENKKYKSLFRFDKNVKTKNFEHLQSHFVCENCKKTNAKSYAIILGPPTKNVRVSV